MQTFSSVDIHIYRFLFTSNLILMLSSIKIVSESVGNASAFDDHSHGKPLKSTKYSAFVGTYRAISPICSSELAFKWAEEIRRSVKDRKARCRYCNREAFFSFFYLFFLFARI